MLALTRLVLSLETVRHRGRMMVDDGLIARLCTLDLRVDIVQ